MGGAASLRGPEASSGPGGGLLGSVLPGGDLLSGSEFELNREQHGGVLSVWSRSARSHFGGRQGALSLNGDVRTTMLGADYTRGRLVTGLSMARSQGLGGYGGRHVGRVESSVTGLYPWLGYKVNDRVSVAARVAPSWGSLAQGSEALWGGGPLSQYGAYGGQAAAGRVDAALAYGLPVGRRLVGTPRLGFGTSAYGRDYQLGYSLGALGVEKMDIELGVETQRRESPLRNGSDVGVLGRASVRW